MPPILQHATMTHTSARNSWILTGKSGSVSCGVTDPFPGSWCTRFCLCPLRIYFPVLGKFWQLYGGVNGDLLQKGLCHTQICCTKSPCPCGSPLLTCTLIRNLGAVAHRAPLSIGFNKQECWSGLPFLSPADLSNPGTESVSLMSLSSPAMAVLYH